MMETVVSTEGTGRRAALEGVRVAGKTGTAQKLDAATGTYSTEKYLAWFAGVAPADDPRIVIVVMLDEPAGLPHYGRCHGGAALRPGRGGPPDPTRDPDGAPAAAAPHRQRPARAGRTTESQRARAGSKDQSSPDPG